MKKLTQDEVLSYNKDVAQSTVKRHYLEWRKQQNPPIPSRCDNPACKFHTGDLIWNGEPVNLQLEHINGANAYNRPENLCLLCPLCHSQTPTFGGGNVGRVDQSASGYRVKLSNGKHFYHMPVRSQHYSFDFG